MDEKNKLSDEINNDIKIEYNSKLFYKIWRNKLLKNIIIKYLKISNHYSICKREYKEIEVFNRCKDKYSVISIIIDRPPDATETIEFLYNLPGNIENVQIENSFPISIDLRDLSLPSTLKSLSLGRYITKINNNFELDFQEEYSIYERVFKNIKKILLPINFKDTRLLQSFQSLTILETGEMFNIELKENNLPPTLTILHIGPDYSHQIGPNVLPTGLKHLLMDCDYKYSSISLPNHLKILSIYRFKSSYKSSFLDNLPSSIEILKLNCSFDKPIESLRNRLPSSIKKLTLGFNSASEYILEKSVVTTPETNNVSSTTLNKKRSSSIISKLISSSLSKKNEPINQQHQKTSETESKLKLLNEIPQSLAVLDFTFLNNSKYISVSTLPKTLVKLILEKSIILSDTHLSLPESLTSFEGGSENHFPLFENSKSNNIKHLSLHFQKIFNGDIDLSYFPKLTSLRVYRHTQKEINFKNTINLPIKLENVEFIILHVPSSYDIQNQSINPIPIHQNSVQHVINDDKLFSIKSYRDGDKTPFSLMCASFKNKSLKSPYSNSILLLDLHFNLSYNKNLPIIHEYLLPQNLRVLIIRGVNTPKLSPLIIDSLKNLEYIYLTHDNKSILDDKEQMNHFSSFIRIFIQSEDMAKGNKSKIYKKLKKYINFK